MSDKQKNVENAVTGNAEDNMSGGTENNPGNTPKLKTKGLNKKLLLGIACILALAVIALLAIFLPKYATSKKVSKQLSLGEKYLSELDYEQAIAAYELAIQIDPKNEDAYIGLAEVYIAMGDLDKAEEVLKDGKRQVDDVKKIREKLKEVEEKQNVAEITSTPIPEPIPTSELTPTPVIADIEGELVDLKNASVGNWVLFGSYEQDADTSNGAEPIEWYVLDRQGDAVLLLSRYILDAIPYNEELGDITWETCTLRSWLNGEFYNMAFTGTEKGYIRQVTLDNPDNSYYGTAGGNATVDRVFLLSLDELRGYFSFGEDYGYTWGYGGDTRLCARLTRQAYEDNKSYYKGFKSDGDEYSPAAIGWWWLRSPGDKSRCVADVSHDGHASLQGSSVHVGYGGVRPALWLNLNPTVASELTPTPDPTLTSEPTPTLEPTRTPVIADGEGELVDLKNASVGNRVLFGSYEQDADTSNGAEPIEWYVLDKQGDSVLLLSRYILDAKPYNVEFEDVTWATSTLRSWLNGEFYNAAFNGMEKDYIRQVSLGNPDNPYYGTAGGNATEDRVFLLSLDELKRYFIFSEYEGNVWNYGGDTRLRAHGTRQAYENNLFMFDPETWKGHSKCNDESYSPAANGQWWLRLPGGNSNTAAAVYCDGNALLYGHSVDGNLGGVRPALWLNLNQTADTEPTPAVADGEGELVDLKNASVGNRVLFGSYEQDADTSNGAEPIEWYVLDKQGDAVLLFSRYILDAKEYNEEYTSVTWETCTLRSWLNGEFYNTAFTGTEKGYIRQVTLDNPENSYSGMMGGNATKDRVFLLSLDELRRHFSFGEDYGSTWGYDGDTRLLAHGTRQAYHDKSLYEHSSDVIGPWWLRSPGINSFSAASVYGGGRADLLGISVDFGDGGVRPALWLNLNQMATLEPTPTTVSEEWKAPEPGPVGAYGEGELVDLKNASVGNRVLFGSYEQDADTSNGEEPIEWYVLDRQGDNVFLFSKYILDSRRYSEEYKSVTWETCTLRSWLNNEFYDTAFNDMEKECILQTTLENLRNPNSYGADENETKDKIFLLSLEELRKYFRVGKAVNNVWKYDGDVRLLAYGTELAYEHHLTYGFNAGSEKLPSTWWLRSPGVILYDAATGGTSGNSADLGGTRRNFETVGVRPALWLKLNP